jgi:predicted ATPase
MVDRGTARLADGEADAGADMLAKALRIWRGPALADVAFADFAQPEIRRLEELRLHALEARIDADLKLGRHAALVSELEDLSLRYPTRERLVGQLMLALYRDGRQADALEVYQRTRIRLAEDIGVNPGPSLQALQADVLAQAVRLATPCDRTESAASADNSPQRLTLPMPSTELVGRGELVADIGHLLEQHPGRLVTLVGPGGVGKTRVALAVGDQARGGVGAVLWADLSAVADPDDVAGVLAGAVGARPEGNETELGATIRLLRTGRRLLIADNFEHVVRAAPLVAELLSACRALTVLTTSREPLRLSCERCVAVEPLELDAAVELFIAAARRHDHEFRASDAPAISAICERLDGLPLAVELAAARTALLTPTEISERIHHAIEIAVGGARDLPERQQTLRATLDWSRRLLGEEEDAAFRRLAVFAGDASIAAIEQITGSTVTTLEALVARQLVQRTGAGPDGTRVRMLQTVREYAGELLQADPAREDLHGAHFRWYLAQHARLYGREHADAVAALTHDAHELMAALDWAIAARPSEALQLIGALDGFWFAPWTGAGALRRIDAALEAADGLAPPADRGNAQLVRVRQLKFREGRDATVGPAQVALELFAEAGDAAGEARALCALSACAIESHALRGEGNIADAVRLAEQAVDRARASGDAPTVAFALGRLAGVVPVAAVEPYLAEATLSLLAVGNLYELAQLQSNVAYGMLAEGRPEDARRVIDADLAEQTVDPFVQVNSRGDRGLAALLAGDLMSAGQLFAEQLELCHRHGCVTISREALGGLAAVAAASGEDQRAARLLGALGPEGMLGHLKILNTIEQRFLRPARHRIGAEAWDREQADGAAIVPDELLAYATATSAAGPAPR